MAVARVAEQAGFDSLWVADRPSSPSPEAYSLLGALATCTRTIRLGALPTGVEPRNPSVLAKIVTGVDVISHGRGVLTLRTGPEDDGTQPARLSEALEVCRAVLEDDEPVFAGRYFRLSGAVNRPRPAQPGGVPLVVTLDAGRALDHDLGAVLVGHTDAVVVEGDADRIEEVVALVRSASGDRSSRAPSVIWQDRLAAPGRNEQDGPPSGPGEELLAERLRHVLGAGASGCIIPVSGNDQLRSIERLGAVLGPLVGPR